jgi:hypothetical protein
VDRQRRSLELWGEQFSELGEGVGGSDNLLTDQGDPATSILVGGAPQPSVFVSQTPTCLGARGRFASGENPTGLLGLRVFRIPHSRVASETLGDSNPAGANVLVDPAEEPFRTTGVVGLSTLMLFHGARRRLVLGLDGDTGHGLSGGSQRVTGNIKSIL